MRLGAVKGVVEHICNIQESGSEPTGMASWSYLLIAEGGTHEDGGNNVGNLACETQGDLWKGLSKPIFNAQLCGEIHGWSLSEARPENVKRAATSSPRWIPLHMV